MKSLRKVPRAGRDVLALLGVLVLSLAQVPAQKPAPADRSQAPSPAFSVNAREVILDVVVTDSKGRVVTQLEQNDFKIYEDGVLQTIRSFTPPRAHAIPANAPAVNSWADLAKIGDAPVTILVLDELDTRFEDMAYARWALEKYLQRQPPRLQQPAVLMVVSDSKFAIIHDYTQDRDALLTTLKAHFPAYPFRLMKNAAGGLDASERMVMVLGSLMQIAEASKGTRGRKNVIWVGRGFPTINTDMDSVNSSRADELNQAIKDATQTLLDARVTLNVIDPTMMTSSTVDIGDSDVITPQDLINATDASGNSLLPGDINFIDFAPATGGFAYALRNDVDAEIASAIEYGSNYFTLTYSPTNQSDDASVARKIRIVMSRPGLTANTRPGYYREPQLKPNEKPPAPAERRLAFDLIDAALSNIVYTGLDGKVSESEGGYTLSIPEKQLGSWERPDGVNGVEVTVMTACFGPHNRVLGHDAEDLPMAIPGDAPQDVEFKIPLLVPRGTVRIRFVVRDAINGKLGTIDVRRR